ncbi:hypothetical protein ILUMI_12026 [Ignelater luminosus]|uniref:Uncharacterized protein n=1 Tax=Ignelater luminosus TaxID=2038154 RepID=A0A8K0GC71_IGNLU|nr:hypothetical protein ILUMI_12026 [Ignelater luminosus]
MEPIIKTEATEDYNKAHLLFTSQETPFSPEMKFSMESILKSEATEDYSKAHLPPFTPDGNDTLLHK